MRIVVESPYRFAVESLARGVGRQRARSREVFYVRDFREADKAVHSSHPPFPGVVLEMDLAPPPEELIRWVVTGDQGSDCCKTPAVETMDEPTVFPRYHVQSAIVTIKDGANVSGGQTVRAAIRHKTLLGNPRRSHPKIPLCILGTDRRETFAAADELEPHISTIWIAYYFVFSSCPNPEPAVARLEHATSVVTKEAVPCPVDTRDRRLTRPKTTSQESESVICACPNASLSVLKETCNFVLLEERILDTLKRSAGLAPPDCASDNSQDNPDVS